MGDQSADNVTFLSWNLAMIERSAEAPPQWDVSDTEAAVRDRVLVLAPDLVLFQELPGFVPFVESHGMVRANPRSHSGNLATLVGLDRMVREPVVTVVPGCALLTTLAEPALTVANVHLAPGPGAIGERLEQVAAVVAASPTEALLIVGDTNTRRAEIGAIEAAGLVTAKPPRPTWDSRRNRFRPGPEYSAYFTRWFASPAVTVSRIKVWHQPLRHDRYQFHLSDHYALSGTVTLRERAG